MRSRFPAIGFVILVIVIAVVVYLNARATQEIAPSLAELKSVAEKTRTPAAGLGVPSTDTLSSAQPPRPFRKMPGLQQMNQNTAQHAAAVQDALADTNQ